MEAEILAKGDYNNEVHSSKDTNGDVNHSGDGPVVNGFSNGIDVKSSKREENLDKHKDRHKDKQRDKDREREKDKHRDRDKEKSRDKDRDRDKEREKHRDKDRDKSSSHKSSSRDKDRDKDKERRDRDKEKSRDKERDGKDRDDKSSLSKEKEKSSNSSKHHSSSSSSKSDKDKHKSSSSSGRDKDKDKHRDRDRDKDKDREKHRDKDKERDKEKDRDKSKHSSGSSSSKDKDRKDKSSSDKPKDSHKERSSSSHKEKYDKSSKEKLSINSVDKVDSKLKSKKSILDDSVEDEPVPQIEKEEMVQVKKEPVIKQEEMDDDEDDYDEDALYIKEEPLDDIDQTNDTSVDVSKVKTEEESDEDDDIPLSSRATKRPPSEEDDDDVPLANKRIKKESKKKRKKGYESEEEDYEEEEDFKPKKKKKPPPPHKKIKTETKVKSETSLTESPTKKKKKEDEHEVWKWWEEEKKDGKTKWSFLEHKGPVFAPPYEPLPSNVKFYYDGKEMRLSEETEEVATFYARMLEHDYVTKDVFNKNFFKDWRKVMTAKEKDTISDLSKCNFKSMHAYFLQKSEERKNKTKEEKKALKEENEQLIEEYGFCVIDGHKEKIGNFKLEPPGLFRGRGEHPKMGMLKKRLNAEDIIINCSKDCNIPKPPEGHRWKEVRHDNTVTWLASWTENVQGQVKYIMLNPSSKLKGEKDWQKYETARKLHKCIEKIRREYKEDWKSKEMRIRQRAVALYFIDKLALRAGNEKDEDQADTVGCCSLRVEHIELHPEKDGKEFVVVFDFLGKDSIRYYNEVPVEKRVFKNLQLFVENKKPGDDLFDRLTTQILNKHLNELMEGLTAKVFRTYNASITLQEQLNLLTDPNYSVPEMLLAYNRANRAVAILCNHQRSIPKSHQKSMDTLKDKISSKKETIDEAEKSYKNAKKCAKNGSAKERILADKAKKRLDKLKEQLTKLEVQETDREENKTIALGTSKLNYLDPRISVAWCKKYNIPIDKVYNKTQRSKFRWAIDMVGPEYIF